MMAPLSSPNPVTPCCRRWCDAVKSTSCCESGLRCFKLNVGITETMNVTFRTKENHLLSGWMYDRRYYPETGDVGPSSQNTVWFQMMVDLMSTVLHFCTVGGTRGDVCHVMWRFSVNLCVCWSDMPTSGAGLSSKLIWSQIFPWFDRWKCHQLRGS